jgi:hypothetical protein
LRSGDRQPGADQPGDPDSVHEPALRLRADTHQGREAEGDTHTDVRDDADRPDLWN